MDVRTEVNFRSTMWNESDWSSSQNDTILGVGDSNANVNKSRCHESASFQIFVDCVRNAAMDEMQYMSPTQVALFSTAYASVSALGVFGNGLVIWVVATRREMRTNRNVLILNLALSNFLLAVILVPFLWTPTYRIEFTSGRFMCKLAQAFPSANIFCSTLTVSVIAVDRYFAVARSRLAPDNSKTLLATAMAAAIWALSFTLSLAYLLHFDIRDYTLPHTYWPKRFLIDQQSSSSSADGGNRSQMSMITADNDLLLFQRCQLLPMPCLAPGRNSSQAADDMCLRGYEALLSAIMAVFIYFVPMPVLFIFNCLLTRFLASKERQHSLLRHRAQTPVGLDEQTDLAEKRRPRTVSGRSAAKSELSAASGGGGRHRRSRTSALLFAMAFSNAVLWLPFIVISLLLQLGPNELTLAYNDEIRFMDDTAKLLSMLSICVNPWLYGFMNTNFNREFRLIFRALSPCFATSSGDRRTLSAGVTISRDRSNLLPTTQTVLNMTSLANDPESSVTCAAAIAFRNGIR